MKKTRNSKENSTPTKENIKYSENPKNVFLIKGKSISNVCMCILLQNSNFFKQYIFFFSL